VAAAIGSEPALQQDGWAWTWAMLGSVLFHLAALAAAGLWQVTDLVRELEAQLAPRVVVLYPGVRTYVPTEAVQAVPEPIREDSPLMAERSTAAANPEPTEERNESVPALDGTQNRYLSSRDAAEGTRLLAPAVPPDLLSPLDNGAASPARVDAGPAAEDAADAGASPVESPASEPVASESAQQRSETAATSVPEPGASAAAADRPSAAAAAAVGGGIDAAAAPPEPATPGAVLPDALTRQERLSVDRFGIAAFDVSESAWGPYVKEVRERIGREWLGIVRRRFAGERMGRVTIRFDILADGRVTGVETEENTAGAMPAGWCVEAIERAAPFAPFPDSLRSQYHRDRKTIHFTFHY